jgi:F-type H+-transporting ATPase subunit delta
MSAVARRYAKAAVEAALERGGESELEALALGMHLFADAYKASPDLKELVRNPALAAQRSEVLRQIGQSLTPSALTTQVVLLLADNERIDELVEVALALKAMADERLARVRAHVVTAVALSTAQQERLASALAKRVGRPVVLEVEVDPSLIGGLVCKVGSATIDTSVRHELVLMGERLSRD